MERYILHCDCNSFFASVELLSYPQLRFLPVAVCGSADDRHGIILAKNEAAKRFQVQTAETIWQAKRKCPTLTLLPPHHDRYRHYSKIINDIYQKYTDRVEPFGIDESWLDVSGTWHLFAASPYALAEKLRQEVKAATGLTISIGVSFNKVFAKLGSDYKKPDATTVITRENYTQIVYPLPVGALLYVGKSAQSTLSALGITTIGQLAAADPALVTDALGKLGTQISSYARGLDDAPVRRCDEATELKSVGNGTTFKRNLLGAADIRTGVNALADSVAWRLRKEGLKCTTVQVIIKDASLKSISRQKPLPFATYLAKDIAAAAYELICANWDMRSPIRMLTVTGLNLTTGDCVQQLSLFEAPKQLDKKQEKLEKAMDTIRGKYGRTAIASGSLLKNDIGLGKIGIKHSEDDEDDTTHSIW
ncbi:MAG: DNA polymerase IV [Oscillospiraceae bacterium]|nr:DNA polymerase IV [Oscillospiraceae bacterium]